jgi:hypothetical protein
MQIFVTISTDEIGGLRPRPASKIPIGKSIAGRKTFVVGCKCFCQFLLRKSGASGPTPHQNYGTENK